MLNNNNGGSRGGDDDRQLSLLGAHGILTPSDLDDLSAGCQRVLALISDNRWHSAEAIRVAAGENGIPASEGLRRLRELRQAGIKIEMRKCAMGARLFEYRMVSQGKKFWVDE